MMKKPNLKNPCWLQMVMISKKRIHKIKLHDIELFIQSIHIRDTKTKVIGIYQLFIKVYDMKYPIGSNLY